MDTLELVGRQHELGLVAAALEDARHGRARAIALVGEPGIGKTAALESAAGLAGGFTVVRATGSVAEREYPYGGLLALLRPLHDEVAALPPAQRAALEAILAAEPGRVERFVVSAGALGVVATVAERTPLLVVVDDAQWLDDPTRDVLAFVIRRLAADRVATIVGARPGGLGPLERAVDLVVELRPLEDEAAAVVLARSGLTLDAEVREALLGAAHGNPLALLELPRRLTPDQRVGSEPLPPSLPAGDLVSRAFAASAAGLAEPTRVALAAAALVDERSLGELESALSSLGVTSRDLEAAEAEGLVVLAPGRVEFRHPLVRSAVLAAAGDAVRRRAHRALADALPSGERRALHLAEAAVGTDPEAAAELVASCRRRSGRHGRRTAHARRGPDRRRHRAGRRCCPTQPSRRWLQAGSARRSRCPAVRSNSTRRRACGVRRSSCSDAPPGSPGPPERRATSSSRAPARSPSMIVSRRRPRWATRFSPVFPGVIQRVTIPLAERFLALAGRADPAERQFADLVEGIALVQSGRGAEGAVIAPLRAGG